MRFCRPGISQQKCISVKRTFAFIFFPSTRKMTAVIWLVPAGNSVSRPILLGRWSHCRSCDGISRFSRVTRGSPFLWGHYRLAVIMNSVPGVTDSSGRFYSRWMPRSADFCKSLLITDYSLWHLHPNFSQCSKISSQWPENRSIPSASHIQSLQLSTSSLTAV